LGPKDQGLSFAEKLIVLSQIIESAEAKAADAVASSGRMPQPTIDPTPVAT
jgi:hypothetical protein